jgi:Tfp pilus assembly protein PilN
MDAHARRGVGGLMLKTNLATKPFYNERVVRNGLIALLLLVVALTAFNALRAVSLRNEEGTLSARATQALADANRLRADARRITAQIDPREMATVSAAASEANNAIDRRAFSWGHLLTTLEATLPDDVRVTSVQPRVEDGTITVTMNIEAMSPESLAKFMDTLEATGSFGQVLPHDQTTGDDDVIDAVVEATYVVPAAPAEQVAAPTRKAPAAATKPPRTSPGASRE